MAETDPFAKYMTQEETSGQQVAEEFDPFAKYDTPVKANKIEEDISTGEWTNLDSLSGAFIFLEGVTLGWSDEVGIGLASLAMSTGSDETQEEIYNRLKKDYDAMQESFSERHGAVATGLEIAGAIVSPISKIKVASGLTGLVARGASEGAIYGAGKAEDVEAMKTEAFKGALGGAAGASVVGAGGWLLKRKIQAPLDTEKGFVPLTLAADKTKGSSEALLQTFYRDIVGPSWGGKGLVRTQEEAVVGPLLATQKQRKKALIDLKDVSSNEAKEATKQLNVALENLKDSTKAQKEGIEEAAKEAAEIIKGDYSKFLGKEGAIINRATKRIQNSIDVNSDAFRLSAFMSSLPAGTKVRQAENIVEAQNPNIAMLRLENLWAEEGFKSIKGRSFTLKPNELLQKVTERVSQNPQLQLLAVNKSEVASLINNSMELLAAKRNPKTGRISGEDLSAVRSAFGTAAASKSDVGGQSVLMQNLYREVQQAVDEQMKSQLSAKGLKAFEQDLEAWATHSVLKDSVLKASTKTGVNGKFSPDDWIAAIKTNSPRQARQGRGPLRAEAENLAALNKKNEQTIVEAANKLSEKMVTRRERELTRINNKAKAERTFLAEQVKKQRALLRNDPEVASKLAENTQKIKALDEEIATSGEELVSIGKARTPENPSWFHSLAATGTLAGAMSGAGFAVAGPIGGGLSLGAALKAGQVLSSPTVQRTLAGQAAPQAAAQRFVQTPVGQQVRQVSPLLGARFGAMLTTQ
jgi:hypothetical protein